MTNSIRVRLTLYYAAVLTATLGAASYFVYQQLTRNHYDRLDTRIETALRVIGSSLDHEIEEHGGVPDGEESFRFVLRTIHPLTFPDLELAVVKGTQTVGTKPQNPTTPLLAKARTTNTVWSENGYRFMRIETIVSGNKYTFIGAGSERQTDAEVQALRQAFLFGLPIPLLLALAGGFWLVRKSLAPVADMSLTADAITADNLSQRLQITNPKDELGRLGKSFNHLLDRLEASFDVQRRFMSDASHEFRTPVSIARTAAQVTLERPERSEAEYRDALTVIDGQLQRMGRLVEDMFLLATSDSGALQLQPERFYLEEVINESASAARLLATKKQIRLSVGPFEELPCLGDLARIRQAIMILLDNAIKYSPANSTINILASNQNGQLQIDITDQGTGIEASDREKIFERFYRPDTSRTRGSENSGGAGLGLPIARRIAEAHSGRLELIESSPNGSHFRLTLL